MYICISWHKRIVYTHFHHCLLLVIYVALSRRIQLAQKFKVLKNKGKLDRYMEKRRRKNVQRDRKSLPNAKT